MHSYTKLSNLQEESHENVKTVQFHVIIEVKWLRPHARSLELDTVDPRTGWRRTRGPKGFALAQPLVNYARDSNIVQNVSLENLLLFWQERLCFFFADPGRSSERSPLSCSRLLC